MAKLLDAIAGEDIVCRTVRKPMDARWYLKLVIDARWAAHPLDPAPPTTAFGALPVLAGAHYQLRRYQQAVEAGRRSWSLNRNWPIGLRYVVAGLAQLGRIEEAHAALAELKRMDVNLEFSASVFRRNWPDPADVDHLLDGLRKAGFE